MERCRKGDLFIYDMQILADDGSVLSIHSPLAAGQRLLSIQFSKRAGLAESFQSAAIYTAPCCAHRFCQGS